MEARLSGTEGGLPKPTPAAVRYRKILASRHPEESIRQLADRHGILPQTLYRWSSRLGPHKPEDAPLSFPST